MNKQVKEPKARSKSLQLAVLLLVLALVTSCFVGGTLSKYTVGDEAGDTARVAKWGVKIEAQGEDVTAFSKEYAATTAGLKDPENNNITLTVKNSTDDKLVAPGTNGQLGKLTITGTPEVAVEVKKEATFKVTGWEIGAEDPKEFYCPIVVKVGSTEISGLTYTTAAEFEMAVVDAIVGTATDGKYYYPPLTDLATKNPETEITWKWAFEPGTGDPANKQTDVKDTALGDKAATATAPTISFEMTVTVTQVD